MLTFQNDPYMCPISESIWNRCIQIEKLSILESNSFSGASDRSVEVRVPEDGYITQPPYSLESITTVDGEHFILNMNFDFHLT